MSSSHHHHLHFLCPSFLFTVVDGTMTDCALTGGSIYAKKVLDGLIALGWKVTCLTVPGIWPLCTWNGGTAEEKAAAKAAILTEIAKVPSGGVLLYEGLLVQDMDEFLNDPIALGRIHSVAFIHHPCSCETGFSAEARKQLLELEMTTITKCPLVITNSSDTQSIIVNTYNLAPETVKVIRPGVHSSNLSNSTTTRPSLERGADGKLFFELVCVANVLPRKGYPILIEAMGGLRSPHDWRLRIAGNTAFDLDETKKVYDMVASLGLQDKIEFLGCVPPEDVSTLYHSSHVFVFPSVYESYGMVVAEAAEAGLPIVTSSGGALSATAPSESSIFCEPGSPVSLREGIERFMNESDVRAHLVAAAEARVKGSWDWTAALAEFNNSLANVAARGSFTA